MRGGVSAARMPSVRVAPSARVSGAGPRAFRQARPQISPTGQANFSSFTNSTNFGSTNGVPGLGFDYPHLAAISGGLRSSRASNSLRGNHRRQDFVAPVFFGGYPFYDYPYSGYVDSSDYEQPQPPQQQPQVIVIQQPVPAVAPQQAIDSGNDPAASLAPPAAAPVRDVGDFLLVRRDGRILFASAFSVGGAQLTYVTPEGIRRSLPLAELDADATQQMNEARGTTVQLHN
jgi:hypothetical protein